MIAPPRRLASWLFAVLTVAACKPTAPQACLNNIACAPDQYCDFTPGLCGQGKRPGICRPRPRACDGAYRPVCGCDRRVYPSECAARAAGVDLAVNGGCDGDRPRDWLSCGAHFCDARRDYCEIVLSDVPEPPTDFTCKPLPPACRPVGNTPPSCRCFPRGTRCLSFCGPSDSGGIPGFHLTCRL